MVSTATTNLSHCSMKAATDYTCGYVPIKLLTKSTGGNVGPTGHYLLTPATIEHIVFVFLTIDFIYSHTHFYFLSWI